MRENSIFPTASAMQSFMAGEQVSTVAHRFRAKTTQAPEKHQGDGAIERDTGYPTWPDDQVTQGGRKWKTKS